MTKLREKQRNRGVVQMYRKLYVNGCVGGGDKKSEACTEETRTVEFSKRRISGYLSSTNFYKFTTYL